MSAAYASDETVQFAKNCSDAAFGYATAGMAAYANTMQQSFDYWSRLAGMEPSKPANPWAGLWNNPFLASTPQPPANPWLASTAMMQAFAAPWMGAQAFNPWQQTTLASWPMAFWMMSAGVPGSVAFPTARANQAAADAADTAKQAMHRAFSSYQSGGGHAAWHIWPASQAMMLGLAFLPKALQGPWASILKV